MFYWTHPVGYWTHPEARPDYTSEAPDPRMSGPGHAYRCLDCDWIGRSAAAYDHHRAERTHRIVLRDAPHWGVVKFGCCHEL